MRLLTGRCAVDHDASVSVPPRSRNADVARLLEEIGELLEIKGEQPFRVNAYRTAARRVEGLREPIEVVQAEGRLRSINGIGPALEQKIGEYLTTGRLEYVERLRAEFPPGLVEILQVPGLGPRKARLVHDQLGVGNLEELEAAARANKLRDVPGLGEKTEERLLKEIERLKVRSRRFQLRTALSLADELVQALEDCPAVERAAVVGSARRMADTIGNLDLLVATRADEICERFVHSLGHVREIVRDDSGAIRALIRDGIQVTVHTAPPEQWGAALLFHTGAVGHVRRLQARARERGWQLGPRGLDTGPKGPKTAGASEDEVYELLGLQPVPPELREDAGEVELAAEQRLPRLLELSDVRGDLHVHSNWSDGGATIEEMVQAAMALGREYIALTDHSKGLGVARGLTEERVAQQRQVLDALNQRVAPFRVFHGTEMDVKRSGALDYEDETLEFLEYVSASIHSAMNQERAVMTARIARAVANPWVTTLNHPHGRLVGSRPPYEVDMAAVVAACAEHGVAMEINAQPERMDLDGATARLAREAGVKLVINTDAHATRQLDMMQYGVATARRAWCGPDDVLNCLSRDQFAEYLAGRRRRAETLKR